MKLLLTIIFIIITGIFGSKRMQFSNSAYLGFKHILITGMEYIFIGLIIGVAGFNIVNASILANLDPYISFAVGWAGLLFGMQFEFKFLSKLPVKYFSISIIKGILTFLTIYALAYFPFKYIFDLNGHALYMFCFFAAAIGSCSSPSALALTDKALTSKPRELIKLLRYISSIDGFIGITLFGIIVCFMNSWLIESYLFFPIYIIISIFIGAISGYVFHILISKRVMEDELLLIIVATVTFASGIGLYFKLSPLFITFIMGLIISNSPWSNHRVLRILIKSEKVIYIILLLLAGAMWNPSLTSIFAGILYTILRIFSKTLSTTLSVKMYKPSYHVPSLSGLTLLSQGGLSIAMVVNLSQILSNNWFELFKSMILTSVILNNIISPPAILYILQKQEKTK